MSPVVPDGILHALGRTEGGDEALGLLVHGQDTRRMVMLRAVLDTAHAAPAAVCAPASLDRLVRDWALLEQAERLDRGAVRTVLLHPLAGPWAQRCLRGLAAPASTAELAVDLAYFSAMAVSAALRAGVPFAVRLRAVGALLVLPTLGALRLDPAAPPVVEAESAGPRVVLRQEGRGAVVLTPGDGGPVAEDPRWLPMRTLPPVLPGGAPVALDDVDPYRTEGSGIEQHGLGAVTSLGPRDREQWSGTWSGVAELLALGGPHRTAEAARLLRSLVPLSPPPGSGPTGEETTHCSGTRREAFGAVLSSKPATAAYFAATLVHELQHTKLAALTDLVTLHHEDDGNRHFAPWRKDPRPFDGLLQGAFSHVALADYWRRFALADDDPVHREFAWAEHSRCGEQVAAVLPVLRASRTLTREGRIVVDAMEDVHRSSAGGAPDAEHLLRARAYVRNAHAMWRERNKL